MDQIPKCFRHSNVAFFYFKQFISHDTCRQYLFSSYCTNQIDIKNIRFQRTRILIGYHLYEHIQTDFWEARNLKSRRLFRSVLQHDAYQIGVYVSCRKIANVCIDHPHLHPMESDAICPRPPAKRISKPENAYSLMISQSRTKTRQS